MPLLRCLGGYLAPLPVPTTQDWKMSAMEVWETRSLVLPVPFHVYSLIIICDGQWYKLYHLIHTPQVSHKILGQSLCLTLSRHGISYRIPVLH